MNTENLHVRVVGSPKVTPTALHQMLKEFDAPSDGKFYVRCNGSWVELPQPPTNTDTSSSTDTDSTDTESEGTVDGGAENPIDTNDENNDVVVEVSSDEMTSEEILDKLVPYSGTLI